MGGSWTTLREAGAPDELETAGPDERESIRRLMVALFQELGQEHPVSVAFRRRLATALY